METSIGKESILNTELRSITSESPGVPTQQIMDGFDAADLLLGLLRFSTPAIEAANKKVMSTLLSGKSSLNQSEDTNKDGELLSTLLLGNEITRNTGLQILRFSLEGLNFEFMEGAQTLGYWTNKDNVQFAYRMCKQGLLRALFILWIRALDPSLASKYGGTITLDSTSFCILMGGIYIISVLHRNIDNGAVESATYVIHTCPAILHDFFTAVQTGLANKHSIIWYEDKFCLLARGISTIQSVSKFIRIGIKQGSTTKSETGNNHIAASSITFGEFSASITSTITSLPFHSAIRSLLENTKDVGNVNSVSLCLVNFTKIPPFFCETALPTVKLLFLTFITAAYRSSQFPVVKDSAIAKNAKLIESRTDNWTSNNFTYLRSSLRHCMYYLLIKNTEYTQAFRNILLDNGLISILTKLLQDPSDRLLVNAGIQLSIYAGQDPEIRAQLIIHGVLENVSVYLHRSPLWFGLDFDEFIELFDLLMDWTKLGIPSSKRSTGSGESNNGGIIIKVTGATGLEHLYAIGIISAVAMNAEELALFRQQHFSKYKELEELLIDTAALTQDPLVYQRVCTALNYLEVSPPLFGKSSNRSSNNIPRQLLSQSHVHQWKVKNVIEWMNHQPFKEFSDTFGKGYIDGPALIELTDDDLIDLGITKSIQRKVILDAIRTLLPKEYTLSSPLRLSSSTSTIRHSLSGGGGGIAASSPTVGVARTISSSSNNFVDTDTLNSPPTPGTNASETAISPLVRTSSMNLPVVVPVKDTYDVFISYRRSTGAHLARLISVYLTLNGFKPFIDVEGLAEGAFDTALETMLNNVQHVVVILSEGALDRCMQDIDNKDFVRKEIATALRLGKNVVPVHSNFRFPTPEELPQDIRGVLVQNMIEWHHGYVDAAINKLVKFLKGHVIPTTNI